MTGVLEQATAAAAGGGFTFVGRKRELDLLLAAIRHPPSVVMVQGEAGVGKSRLVHEALARLDGEGLRVLSGSCHPLREPFPYGPVVGALRKVEAWLPDVGDVPPTVGALAPLLPDLAARLPQPPPLPDDPPGRRHQVVQAVRSLLTLIGPAVLILEDMHWADDATRDLLLQLARDLPEQLGLLLTYRAEDLPPGTAVLGAAYRQPPGTSGTTIRLGPLTRSDIDRLAVAALGAFTPQDLGATLYERSEGLPLVAEEDLLTLCESGRHLDHGDLAAELRGAEVPRGLSEAVTERLDTLSSSGAAIVDAAAVLAVAADEELLAAVAALDREQSHEGLTDALRASVLHETDSGAYVFRHTLAQQVAYTHISGPRRARLHRRAVEVLSARTPAPLVQIAHHTRAAGDREAWLRCAEEAADQATAMGDTGTASTLLRQILQSPGLPAEPRSRAALALARAAAFGVDFESSAAVLRRILADPQLTGPTLGEIRLGLGLLIVNHDGDATGFAELERAADELSALPERAARAMAALAIRERGAGAERAEEWLERAEQIVKDSPNEAVRAAVRATRLSLMAREGDPAVWPLLDALPRRSEDLEVLRQTVRALHNVAESTIDLGYDAHATALLQESRALAGQVGNPGIERCCMVDLLWLDGAAGRWSGLEEQFAALTAAYPEFPPKAESAMCLARIALAEGRSGLAKELADSAAEHALRHFEVNISLRAAAVQAEVLLRQGDAEGARVVVEPAVAVLREAGAWARPNSLITHAVLTLLACGDRGSAERLVDEFEANLAGRDSPAAQAELHYARGALLQESAPLPAAERFQACRQLLAEMGRPYEAALATEAYGCAVARTDPRAAEAPLREALDVYTRLGAGAAVARGERRMTELGLEQPTRGGGRGYGNELSPREQQVAELLARGATNHDIAQTLFLSPRTVEKHVASVLKKLGTTRRNIATVFQPDAR
ncbi:helix-turn-helix transcriptional regulator [Streptacidiphilus neutrinimicus]|uniref:helix-turn-helix transcriptional regulator n=1 Tax=Streptacidiphilus neutrinimicus TaxID=105420 RepID=UPI000A6A207C|nr:LuxR family transcriptional regulator [Streptacidiphilus neutrinimicus]